MQEDWKDILGYEGLYQVSNLGRVKSLSRTITSKNQFVTFETNIKGKILSPGKDSRGYHQVNLCKEGETVLVLVHRLVMSSFVDNVEDKYSVNHEDGNKLNNALSNLTWSTRSEQMLHAYTKGLISPKTGENNGRCKLTSDTVLEIVKLSREGIRNKDIATKTGANKHQVSSILLGKSWSSVTNINKR